MARHVPPIEQYKQLMSAIVNRFTIIRSVKGDTLPTAQEAETIGFQLRKIVEGVAFGCLVAIENGLKEVPREASGQWNADRIFVALKKKGTTPLPNPNIQRPPTEDEKKDHPGVKFVMEGQPDLCLSIDQLRDIYRRTHMWTHEANPYLGRKSNEDHVHVLLADVDAIFKMLNFHIIGIGGEAFFCDLNNADGEPRIASASKVGNLDRIEAVL